MSGNKNPGPSDDQRSRLLGAAQRGAPNKDAAALAGVSERALYYWLSDDAHAGFAEDYARARATGRYRSVRLIADSDDWRAHAWLLERTDPTNWGKAETDGQTMANKLTAYLQGVEDTTDAARSSDA